MKNIYSTVLLGLLVVPTSVFGAAQNFKTVSGVFEFACTLFYWLFVALIFAAVVFILWSAFDYLTAGGDGKKVNEAGKKLLYAVIAVVVALVANEVPWLAANLSGMDLTVSDLPSCLK